MQTIKKLFCELPKLESIKPIYALIMFAIYNWAIFSYLKQVPAWLKFLALEEVFFVLCYVILFSFVESTLLLFGVVVIWIFLPRKIKNIGFAPFGIVVTVSLILALLVYWLLIIPATVFYFFPVLILFLLVFGFATIKSQSMRKIIEWLSDYPLVFLNIYIPITILVTLIIFILNI